MAADFDKISKWYDSFFNQIYFNSLYKRAIDFVKDYLKPGQKYLDIGCGTGNWFLKIKNYNLNLSGLDDSQEMIQIARSKNAALDLRVGQAENLPFGTQEFDFVSIIEAFHHFKEPKKAIAEASRVLKPGGYFLLIDPALDGFLKFIWIASKISSFERHSHFFRIKDIILMSENAGFKILKSQSKLANAWILAQKN